MSFSEGLKVFYKGKPGIIDFVDVQYVVVKWEHTSARLVVYPNQYDTITLLKSSEK